MRTQAIEQVVHSAKRPFSAEWYAANPTITPIPTLQNNAWLSSTWKDVQEWVGVTAEPQRLDFRTDDRGLILVYRDDVLQGRAVDARNPALELALSNQTELGEETGLSLGVFAAVPPSLKPATSLLHLVLDKNGLITGYVVDLASSEVRPLHGAVDTASQRAAWRAGDDVMAVGLANLTEEVSRAPYFSRRWMDAALDPDAN